MSESDVVNHFFRLSKPIYYLVILPAAYCLGLSVYAPELITWHCGPLGQLAKHLAETHWSFMHFLFLLGVGIHLVETVFAVHYCRKNKLDISSSIKWIIQTILLGMFSLYMLIQYSNKNDINKANKMENAKRE